MHHYGFLDRPAPRQMLCVMFWCCNHWKRNFTYKLHQHTTKEKYISRRILKKKIESSIKNNFDSITLLSAYTDEVNRDTIALFLPQDMKNCVKAEEPKPKLFGKNYPRRSRPEWKTSLKSMGRALPHGTRNQLDGDT